MLSMAAALTACSSATPGSTGTPSANAGPVTLEFWCWGTSQKAKVEAFTKAHPDVQVKHTDVGGGTDTAAKLLTANRAGNGPDGVCLEYDTLPSMIVAGALADISAYTGDVKNAFSPEVWALTSFDGAVYGVPQDVGPMVLVYNRKRFGELKIEPPATWQDFAKVARSSRSAPRG
ncbi:extracellular solute-binding protein [Nonomuraea sp. K274]|uniref:Extracellular solute-binding protein n=2 Tax=Nonomuraea cypriaca TaxID=1187855 RepID=A0A931AHB7_9ACTN|nr:extracellular solute-binding protein [Nonomuraea cypriaca]